MRKGVFIGIAPRRAHRLDLHGPAPVARGGDGSAVRAKADQDGFVVISRATEFADVKLALPTHSCGGRVADVRVVDPDDGFATSPMMAHERLQGLEHVAIPQIPQFAGPAVHDAIILFCGSHDVCVLHGVEIGLRVSLRMREPLGEQVAELRDRFVLARIASTAQDPIAVGLGLLLPWRKATISVASDLRGLGIHAIKVAEHGRHRSAEAVDVEAMEGDALIQGKGFVVNSQPIGERLHFSVAPHPRRKAGEWLAAGRKSFAMPH